MGNKFWQVYLKVVRWILYIISLLLIVLWCYLVKYNETDPYSKAKQVIGWFNNHKINNIMEYLNLEYEDSKKIYDFLDSNILKGKYSYEQSSNTNNQITYNLILNDQVVGNFVIESVTLKYARNISEYNIANINILNEYLTNYTFIVPHGSMIIINNKNLLKDYLITENEIPSRLEAIHKYSNIDAMDQYEVPLYLEPNVEICKDGKSINYVKINNEYQYIYNDNQELLTELSTKIEEFAKKYARFVMAENEFSSITPYLVKKSNAYSMLKAISYSNVTLTNHTAIKFDEIKINNMRLLNEDAFMVEVQFTYSYYFGRQYREYPTHLTLYYVKSNNNWLIVDINT